MAISIDGKAISLELKGGLIKEVAKMERKPRLTVFVLSEDLATEKFIGLKQRFAEAVGVSVRIIRMPQTTSTETLVGEIANAISESDGVIVQFPLPPHIDRSVVSNAVPASHDVDVISDEALALFKKGESVILPPVVGALKEILDRGEVSLAGKQVVVVGEGRLVGAPAALWARLQGADVISVNEHTPDITESTQRADVLILGAGSPSLITPSMIREGVVLLDAGTSEAQGKLAGDADPRCVEKASIFTPVPGGIGPITVALIFKNLIALSTKRA